MLDCIIEADAKSKNGLSTYATYNFFLARNAILEKMFEDFEKDLLDAQRLTDLWFDGLGVELVGRVISNSITSQLV